MSNASSEVLKVPMNKIRDNKYAQLSGWNQYCKEVHSLARDTFTIWNEAGKPRRDVLADNMRRTRSQFTHAIQFCKQNTESIVSDKIANRLLKRDTQEFWSEIKKPNSHKPFQVDNIDGNKGKSVDNEGITAEHLQESDDKLKVLLVMCLMRC